LVASLDALLSVKAFAPWPGLGLSVCGDSDPGEPGIDPGPAGPEYETSEECGGGVLVGEQ
jgi:hypothetical protein